MHTEGQSASKWTVLVWQIQGFPLSECFLQLLKGLLGDCLSSSAPANTAATADLLSDRNFIAQCLPDKMNQIFTECKLALSH